MELRCVVVNSGRVLVVTLSEDKSASDLQDAIKSMLGPKAPCIAHRLKLYMTKATDDKSWLRISPEDVDDMAKGKIPETIQAFMTSKTLYPKVPEIE
ncbi:hypothetical protein Poli38472_014370 [Pythium oligandrum]|uniref:Crinkler effector protein N-terminal domain-containing protein n=1 Tax=Pythium oligandrum TaxID=41045 RepID=A0A8K1FFL0_PYTOL|nr:hypothetical protein Poli38472_014370 [Pythium oligandrum]|eukprot:TMW57767.1 hypothetical protein Poli38472_014370 [Pythium oligandrum]